MPLYDYLTPKLPTLDANLTTANRFFTKDDWRCERFENFESDRHYELNPESEVRFKIESNLEALQVPTVKSFKAQSENVSDSNITVQQSNVM